MSSTAQLQSFETNKYLWWAGFVEITYEVALSVFSFLVWTNVWTWDPTAYMTVLVVDVGIVFLLFLASIFIHWFSSDAGNVRMLPLRNYTSHFSKQLFYNTFIMASAIIYFNNFNSIIGIPVYGSNPTQYIFYNLSNLAWELTVFINLGSFIDLTKSHRMADLVNAMRLAASRNVAALAAKNGGKGIQSTLLGKNTKARTEKSQADHYNAL